MTEFLSKFDGGETLGLVAIAGSMIWGLTATLGGILARSWRQSRELALKEEMVARGMTADEIRMVIECSAAQRSCPNAGTPT